MLTPFGQGKLVTRDPKCQQCFMLLHACYGLAGKVCGQFQWDKKECREVVVEGEFLSSSHVYRF